MTHPTSEAEAGTARRMFELTEPVCLVNFFSEEPNDAMAALGLTTYWDGYFAGRSAPLGRVPAEVVDAAFYSFGPGEVARHVPKVWETTTPEAARAARQQGCVAALRRILGADLAGSPGLVRAADLLAVAATSAPVGGRVLYAALRSLPVPEEPVARLWHCADMLREHRGDGHVVALVAEGVGGVESHVLSALDMGIHPAETFGRVHHHPRPFLDALMAGLRDRGIVDVDGRFTPEGRATKDRVEALTDRLAWAPYAALSAAEVEELAACLAPVAARLRETGSR